MIKEVLSFNITNTTTGLVPVSLFGNNANLQDNANATTRYSWNTTTYVPSTENFVELQYSTPTDPTLRTITANLGDNSVQGIANALNTLGLGLFFVENFGGGDVLTAYSDNFIYGYVNIFTLNQVVTTISGFMTAGGDSLNFLINAVPVASFVGAVPISGSFSTSDGSTLNVNGVQGVVGFPVFVYQDPENIPIFSFPATPAAPYTFTWTALPTKSYRIQLFP